MNNEDKLVDTHYAAAYLGIASQTLNTWRARGIGPEYIYLSPAGKTKAGVRYKLSVLETFHVQWKIETKRNPQKTGTTRLEETRYPFVRGFAGAIADALRVGLPLGEARRIIVARKLTVEVFERAGAPAADLGQIAKAMRSPLAKAKPGEEPIGGEASGRGRKPRKRVKVPGETSKPLDAALKILLADAD